MRVSQDLRQLLAQEAVSLSHRDAVLQKKPAKWIDYGRPLPYQARTHSMRCLQV